MKNIISILLTPIHAFRVRYIPLLFIYFAYGSSVFTAIAKDFWVKESLNMSAENLVSLGVWLTVPWTVKMIFGQLVDSVKIFGSNRKIYVYIGATLITISTLLLISIVGKYNFLVNYNIESVYILASILGVIGFVMQDVVADVMTTEVIDETQTKEQIKIELATIQVLARLSLGFAIFITGYLGGKLAAIYDYETVFIISLFIPIISIIGISIIRLNPVPVSKLNKKILFGGLLFTIFVVLIGYNDVAYAQEITFIISISVVLYFLSNIIGDLDKNSIKHIKMAMIVIFVYRAMPSVGPAFTWWQIDVLGFDKDFFATLAAIGGGIALLGMWFSAKFIVKQSISKILILLTIIYFILSLPMVAMYYNVHTMLGINARTIALLDTAIASPFDYIAGVLMLTLVAIYAPAGKKSNLVCFNGITYESCIICWWYIY